MSQNNEKLTQTASTFPEHGPIDENGREILLSVKNLDTRKARPAAAERSHHPGR